MTGKIRAAVIVVFLIALILSVCGCGDKTVNTFIITDEFGKSIDTGKVYPLGDLLGGMKPIKFAGFDEYDNIVGLFMSDNAYYVAEVDFIINRFNVIQSSESRIENVFVTMGNTVVYETAENNVHRIYKIDIKGRGKKLITEFSADKSYTAVNGKGDIVSVISEGEKLNLLCTDVNAEYESVMDITQSYDDFMKDSSNGHAEIKSITLSDNLNISAVVLSDDLYYLYMGSAQGSGFSGCVIDNCKNSGCVFSGEVLFYVDENEALVSYDKKERKKVTQMIGVDIFDVSGDGSLIVGSKVGGKYIKLYAKNVKTDETELIDMQQGLSGCMLNKTGSYVLVKCEKVSPAGYFVTELIQ